MLRLGNFRIDRGLLWGCLGFGCWGLLAACGGSTSKGPDSEPVAGRSSGGAGTTGGAPSAGTMATSGSAGRAQAGSGTAGASSGSGGAVAGEGGAAGSGLPVDERPARPDWDPPFPVGTPGWRDSEEPLCEKHQGLQSAFDVWADARGVFALFTANCNALAGVLCGKEGVSIQHNDGTGWNLVYQVPPGNSDLTQLQSLTGFPNGPLVATGFLEENSGISFVSDGDATFQGVMGLSAPFVVGSDLAYALSGLVVYEFSDGSWAELAELPGPGSSLWANEEVVVVVGPDQSVYAKEVSDDAFETIPDVPAGDYTAVWGFGADDLWAGNRAGQLVHYDGMSWEVVPTGSGDTSGSGITELWGSEGQLFFLTLTEFGRVDGQDVEILLAPPSDADPSLPRVSTVGLWGLSPTEVFLTLADKEFRQYACGEQFILWFDGSEFHAF